MTDLPAAHRPGPSLRHRLLISSLLGTVPLMLLGAILLLNWYYSRRSLILQSNQELARLAGAYAEGWVGGHLRTLRTLAGSIEIQNGTRADMRALVLRQQRAQPEWTNIFVTDARGQEVANSAGALVYIGDRAYFQQARRTQRAAVSDLLISRANKAQVVVLAYPILRDGRFAGVVATTISPQQLQHLFMQIEIEPSTFVALWDSEGHLMARTDLPASVLGRKYTGEYVRTILSRRSGTAILDNPVTGGRMLIGYAPVEGTSWVTVHGSPYRFALAPILMGFLWLSLLSLLVITITLLWSYYSANLIGRQVATLAESARAIGAGKLATRVTLGAGNELDDLAESLNKMAADLAVVERLKSDLLGLVSHELKTPLTSIRTALEVLESGIVTPGQPRYQEVITTAERQARRLQDLIENLISVGRIQAGGLAVLPRPTNLMSTLRPALDLYADAIAEKHLTLVTDVPPDLRVMADAPRITLVVSNLLDNAVKFTSHGHITLQARADDTHAIISVTDTGKGLAPEEMATLFEPFTQREPLLTRSASGAGLGLAVVKAIVEAHGGRVWVESQGPGTGSTFSFSLPLAP